MQNDSTNLIRPVSFSTPPKENGSALSGGPNKGGIPSEVFRKAMPDTIHIGCKYLDREGLLSSRRWYEDTNCPGRWFLGKDMIPEDIRMVYNTKGSWLKVEFELYKRISDSPLITPADVDAESIIKDLNEYLQQAGCIPGTDSGQFRVTRFDTRVLALPITVEQYETLMALQKGLQLRRSGDAYYPYESDNKITWMARGRNLRRSGMTVYIKVPKKCSQPVDGLILQFEIHLGQAHEHRSCFKRFDQVDRDLNSVLTTPDLWDDIFAWGFKRFGLDKAPVLVSAEGILKEILLSSQNFTWKKNRLDWLQGKPLKKNTSSYFRDIQNRFGKSVSFVEGNFEFDLREILLIDAVQAM